VRIESSTPADATGVSWVGGMEEEVGIEEAGGVGNWTRSVG
jgi:hypothetical protein